MSCVSQKAACPARAPLMVVSAAGRRLARAGVAWHATNRCLPAFGTCVVPRVAAVAAVSQQQRARRGLHVCASWGAPVEFSPAKVVSNTRVADKLHQMVVDVGADTAAGYTTPGQFVQLKVGEGKPGFFAIASPPDPNNQGVLEFLIKAQGEAAEALTALSGGASIQTSPVMGKGFPLDRIPPSSFPTVLLFATGSGISPIKAVIESGALDTAARKDVRLYYGTRSKESTAYQGSIPSWEAEGVKVTQVFSDGDDGKYVQEVFAQSTGLNGNSNVGVVCCGQKDMVNAVKALLVEQGVPEKNVLLNF